VAIAVIEWVWNNSRSRHGARLVLLAIADCANSADGTGAWPSIKELARKAAISPTAVHAAIRSLIELGELKVELNAGKAGPTGTTNSYQVIMINYQDAVTQRNNPPRNPPAKSAPRTDSAPLPKRNPCEISTPAESAPLPISDGGGAESSMEGVPISDGGGAESVPGTVLNQHLEPSRNRSAAYAAAAKEYDLDTAPGMVAFWVDQCRYRPPEQVIARVGRDLRALLNQKIDPELVFLGLGHWHRLGRDPSTLASIVNEVMQNDGVLPNRGSRNGESRQSVGDSRVAAGEQRKAARRQRMATGQQGAIG